MQSDPGKKEDNSSNIIDMLLGKTENKTVDSETLIKNVQDRIRDSIKEGYRYSRIVDASEKFLRKLELIYLTSENLS